MNLSIGNDAAKLTASQVISTLVSLMMAIMLSHYRSLEEYGTYIQLTTVIQLGSSLLMLGLPLSISYFLARTDSNEDKKSFISTYYTLASILSMLLSCLLVLSIPFIENYFRNYRIREYWYIFALLPWARIVIASAEPIFINYRALFGLLAIKTANSVFLLTAITVSKTNSFSFTMYMGIYIIVELAFSFVVLFRSRKLVGGITASFDIPMIRKILQYSIPIGLASAVGTLNIELDKLVIGGFFDVKRLAIYSNASKGSPVEIIAVSLTAALLPHIARFLKKGEYQKAIDFWKEASLLSYMCMCFILTGFFVFAPDLITLLFSDKYLPGVTVFRIYNIALLLRFTYFGIILSSIGRTKLILYSSIAALGLNFGLNYLCYYWFGFIGPAIATVASQFAINSLQLLFTSQITKIGFRRLLPWLEIAKITFVNILFGLMAVSAKKLLGLEKGIGSISETIIISTIWGLLYLVVFYREIAKHWQALNRGE